MGCDRWQCLAPRARALQPFACFVRLPPSPVDPIRTRATAAAISLQLGLAGCEISTPVRPRVAVARMYAHASLCVAVAHATRHVSLPHVGCLRRVNATCPGCALVATGARRRRTLRAARAHVACCTFRHHSSTHSNTHAPATVPALGRPLAAPWATRARRGAARRALMRAGARRCRTGPVDRRVVADFLRHLQPLGEYRWMDR